MRDQEILLIVGRMKTGKTTFVINLASRLPLVIVIATFAHPKYIEAGYQVIHSDKISAFKSGHAIVFDKDPEELMNIVRNLVRNAFVIFEDATKYILNTVSKDVRSIIIDHRNIGLDLCFIFHSLPNVPPFIACNYHRIVLFKTGQRELKQSAIEKFPNYYELTEANRTIEQHQNSYYNQVIRLHD